MIIYTSGSTGYPKGVMLTNYNVLSSIRSTAYYLKNNSADRVLCLLPLSFNYGLGQLLCMVMVGGTTVLHHIPMASEIVNAFQYYEITGFAAVPPIWVDLTAYLQEEPVSFPKLKYITNAGGKCPTPTLKKLPLCFPDAKIYLMYGMTETVRSTFLDPLFFNHKIGSLGKAVPGAEIFVVDDNSHICKPKQVGEIVHRGSSVCLGYLKRDEETHKKLKPAYTIQGIAGNDLVCFSGDLGYQDEEGYFWFVGRKDMMIKVKGFRVSPDEIRDIFMHVQGVHDAIAFGLLNDDDIEEIHAVVVPEEKNSVQVDSLRGYCRSHMPGYMMPSHIHIWEKELPKTVNGKIDIQSIKASINNLFKNKETLSYVN
jgi:acyl-CoA synthetase (AMP-forming)/AMP-acid ligase II